MLSSRSLVQIQPGASTGPSYPRHFPKARMMQNASAEAGNAFLRNSKSQRIQFPRHPKRELAYLPQPSPLCWSIGIPNPMQNLIYYPGFEVVDNDWLKFALLYIDK